MKKKFTLGVALFCLLNNASAQLSQTCFSENFNVQTTGWVYSQGVSEGPYSNPVGCTSDRGLITPGIGGNNPANIQTPNFTSTGAANIQVSFDIFCVASNLTCNSWKDFGCPTSIDVFYYVGATKYTAILDLVLPANGPTHSPNVSFNFSAAGHLPAGTVYSLEFDFKPKSGIGNCGQPGTKYILDNFKKCEIICSNCTIDAVNDSYCMQSNTDVVTGDLSTNDTKYVGASVTYSLANGPFANGNSTTGGANLTINPNGTFTITRTDLTKSIFDFTYKVTDSLLGLTDLASVTVCFPVGGALPILLRDFSANRKNRTAVLNWNTSSENNAQKFDIERLDGNNFIPVGSVGARNLATGSQYSFSESNSASSTTQYRLKLVDKDGKFRYSETRAVKGIGTMIDFNILPSSSIGTVRLTLSDVSEQVSLQVLDGLGRVLRTISNASAGTIEIKNLQSGLLFIRMTTSSSGQVTKKTIIN